MAYPSTMYQCASMSTYFASYLFCISWRTSRALAHHHWLSISKSLENLSTFLGKSQTKITTSIFWWNEARNKNHPETYRPPKFKLNLQWQWPIQSMNKHTWWIRWLKIQHSVSEVTHTVVAALDPSPPSAFIHPTSPVEPSITSIDWTFSLKWNTEIA